MQLATDWRKGSMALALLVALLVGACTSSPPADEQGSESSPPTAFEPKPAIVLVVNDWTASALNVSVAEQLIERHLGYPVLPTRLDDTTEIFDGLADGSLDAMLEVWPSTMSERERRYFERGEVLDAGDLGSVAEVGWFVPRYVIEQHPELATWEGFVTPEAAGLFATGATRPLGRFLGTNPDYQQYDQEIIDNLGLAFQVEFSGSEAATVAELDARHGAGEPVVLYWWTPTAAVAAYDLVKVALPEPTEACLASAQAGDGRVECGYPQDVLFKASTPGLAAKAPDVSRFVEQFTLTTSDQLQLLAAVEGRGVTIDAAAATWIEANEDLWRTWLEP